MAVPRISQFLHRGFHRVRRTMVLTVVATLITGMMAVVVAAPAGATTAGTGRGSVAVGSAGYAVPAGALFVDVTVGVDTAAGTLAAPLKTVAAAIAKATTGKTIVLRAGTYNESVTIPSAKTLTIQAYPNEAVWFDGSTPVSTWVKSGSTWVASGWTPEFSSAAGFTSTDERTRFVDPAYPMASYPDQVFVDGAALAQVASAAQVVGGTFAVDYAANTITIGSDPTGKEVRASNLAQALVVTSPNSVLQGFGVRRYATTMNLLGAVHICKPGSVVRDLVIQDNATVGISITAINVTAQRLTVTNNGTLGVHANQADGLAISDSVMNGNNSEHFKTAPVAGGIKVTQTRGIDLVNNDVSGNIHSTGMWMDESVYDMNISNNSTVGNGANGIEIEISDTAIVANNKSTGNAIAGILVFSSANIKMYNNMVGGNANFGIQISQDKRRQADASFTGHDARRPIPDPTMTWIVKNIVIANNAFGNGGWFQVYALDKETNIPVDAMNVTINGNLFNLRVVSANPSMVAWGGNNNVTLTRYETPAALAAAKNPAWHNAITTTSKPIESMTTDIANATTIAVPLPQDIASAIGQNAGTLRVGTFW